jgi:hypothetical protein
MLVPKVTSAFVLLILDDFALVLDDSKGAYFWPEFFSVVKKIKAKYPFFELRSFIAAELYT